MYKNWKLDITDFSLISVFLKETLFLKRPVSSMQIHSHLPLELTLTLSHKYTTFQLNKKDGLECKSLLERKSEKPLPCFKFPLLSSAYESCTWYVSSNKSSQEPGLPVQSLGCFDLSYTSHLQQPRLTTVLKWFKTQYSVEFPSFLRSSINVCPFPIVKLRVCGKFGCCLKKDAEGAGHELLLLLRKWTKLSLLSASVVRMEREGF